MVGSPFSGIEESLRNGSGDFGNEEGLLDVSDKDAEEQFVCDLKLLFSPIPF